MLRLFTLLAVTAVLACAGGRPGEAPAAAAAKHVSPAAAGSVAPRLSRFGQRTVLSWIERDAAGVPALRFAFRAGQDWSPPLTAVRDALLAPDTADAPAVVPLADGGLAAQWVVKRAGSNEARDLMVAVSHDGGATWTQPVRPHRDNTGTEHGMATLLPQTGGGFGVCWLDGRAGALSEYGEGATALYWSEWSGNAFGPETQLDARVCDCCKTAVAQGPAGPVIAYRDRDPKDLRDISIIRKEGAAWSQPVAVHDDGWTLSACPTNGPAIATGGARTAVAWFTGAHSAPSVWASVSEDGGATLQAPVRIDGGAPVGRVDAAMLADGSTAIVWLERKDDRAEIRVRRLTAEGTLTAPVVVDTTSPSRASGYPSIVPGEARDVLVAWTETGTPTQVRAAAVTLP